MRKPGTATFKQQSYRSDCQDEPCLFYCPGNVEPLVSLLEISLLLVPCGSVSSHWLLFEPRCEKTGLLGFRPGPTQTRL